MKAILWLAVVIFPAAGLADDALSPGDELVSLIDRCCGNLSEDELTAPVQKRVKKFVRDPGFIRDYGNPPDPLRVRLNHDWLLTELGHHLLVNAATLGDGLPPVSRFSRPHRLGPLFDGMLPDRFEKEPAAMLRPLLPWVTPEWLDTAADCGAFDFVHSVRLLRGEISDLLLAYQQVENESGLLRLGGVLGRFPELAEQVKPTDFATATLALLLSGAFSDSNFQGQPAATLAIACGKWSAHHPGLVDELERITPPISCVGLCRIARCLLRGEREEAQRLMADTPDYYQVSVRELLYALQSSADPGGPEAVAAAQAMTSGQLTGVLSQMLDINKHDDREVERALPLLRELLTRRDLPEGSRHSVCHLPHARAVALRWWLAGKEDAAYELETLAFLTNQPTEHYWGFNRIVELARAAGRDQDLAAAVERQAGVWGERRLAFHRQAIREVLGPTPVTPSINDPFHVREKWRILSALCGSPGAARECFAKLPAEKQADFAPWLILTGSQDLWKNAAAAPAGAPVENSAGFSGRGFAIRVPAKPGGRFDPRSTDFLAFDAMGEVRRLLETGSIDQAQHLFRRAQVRCLLDDLEPQPVTIIVEGLADRPCGWVSRDLRLPPLDMLSFMIACWDLDAPFLREQIARELRRGPEGLQDTAYLPLALYLVRRGDFEGAQTAAIRYQNPPTNRWEQHRISLLAWVDGLAQAAAGQTHDAVLRLNACMELSPADSAPGMAIIACLEKHSGKEAAATAKATVREYWRSKLERQPDDSAVREAAQHWLAMVEPH